MKRYLFTLISCIILNCLRFGANLSDSLPYASTIESINNKCDYINYKVKTDDFKSHSNSIIDFSLLDSNDTLNKPNSPSGNLCSKIDISKEYNRIIAIVERNKLDYSHETFFLELEELFEKYRTSIDYQSFLEFRDKSFKLLENRKLWYEEKLANKLMPYFYRTDKSFLLHDEIIDSLCVDLSIITEDIEFGSKLIFLRNGLNSIDAYLIYSELSQKNLVKYRMFLTRGGKGEKIKQFRPIKNIPELECINLFNQDNASYINKIFGTEIEQRKGVLSFLLDEDVRIIGVDIEGLIKDAIAKENARKLGVE
jgi:hypothetical protein